MPGVDTNPIGSGSAAPANCQASPPSTSFTSLGALSRYCFGSQVSQISGGSRMWASAETISWLAIAPPLSDAHVRLEEDVAPCHTPLGPRKMSRTRYSSSPPQPLLSVKI